MSRISTACQNANVIPVYEYKNQHEWRGLDKLIEIMQQNKTWRLIYDPSHYVNKQTIDPYDKYWMRIKEYVDIVDIHDYKTGVGHKPLGFGDCRLSDTLQDIKNNKKQCWVLIEPKLGRKHSTAITKSDSFMMAYKRFQEVMT
jgi:sugar phosphate isomerase/epimerase